MFHLKDRHIPQLHRNERVELVAFIEPNSKPASNMAELMSTESLSALYSVPVFSSFDSFLEEGLEVDGFLVSSTHSTHFEIGMKVIKLNKNLLLEKPMTIDVVEAEQLTNLSSSDRFSKFFQINHTANWREQTQKASELLQFGAIGTVRYNRTILPNTSVFQVAPFF